MQPSPNRFAQVLLAKPLEAFTYNIPEELQGLIHVGDRVVVPFGKQRLYSGIVLSIQDSHNSEYEVKSIEEHLGTALATDKTLQFWKWMAEHYLCATGDVCSAALPSIMKLASETEITCKAHLDELPNDIKPQQRELLAMVKNSEKCTTADLQKEFGPKALKWISLLVERDLLHIKEKVNSGSLERKIKIISLVNGADIQEFFKNNDPRIDGQKKVLMQLYALSSQKKASPALRDVLEASGGTLAQAKALEKKGFIQIKEVYFSNYLLPEKEITFKELTEAQQIAFDEIEKSFEEKQVCLLHGVTSSGKTEVYVHLLKKALDQGLQALFLVPEIALTTQLISRLKVFFGERISLYHSKMTERERSEIWESVRKGSNSASLVVGARSAVFLPYSKLDLIIVDEEHEASYKQERPKPRYHGRDAAIVLAKLYGAKTLLGSATPSIETYFNCQRKVYGLVELTTRFQGIQMPEIELINFGTESKKKKVQGNFSEILLDKIRSFNSKGKQTIIFQNRRGYAPMILCNDCGHIPQCVHCDISLTFHKLSHELKCHYCGYTEKPTSACKACGSLDIKMQGVGTEMAEHELQGIFPEIAVKRLDSDTTRRKNALSEIIKSFENGETQILVGTQMLSKGLDFKNVALVGVINADTLLYYPEYKAIERAFQILEQVAGRSGRHGDRGIVLIQTHNDKHPIFTWLQEHDYKTFYQNQIAERRNFAYPPWVRLVRLVVKHPDISLLSKASMPLADRLRKEVGAQVLGPEFPSVSRINKEYVQHITLKFARDKNYKANKLKLRQICETYFSWTGFKQVKYYFEVDI